MGLCFTQLAEQWHGMFAYYDAFKGSKFRLDQIK